MHTVTLGMFQTRLDAENALEELQALGYHTKDISILMRDDGTGEKQKVMEAAPGAKVASGVVSGAATGTIVGGLAGLLIGIGAITIPGVGAVLIGGPLAATLGLTGAAATTVSGAVTGAAAGGLIGALVGLGLPKEKAAVYEKQIKEGGILVAVPSDTQKDAQAREILHVNGATQVDTI